jgi:hypothetical protein
MNWRGGVLAIVLCFQAVAAQNAIGSTVASIVEADKWTLAQGSHNGKPVVIRYRDGFESRPDISAYPHRLTVTWSFEPDKSGMPSRASNDVMTAFEDHLIIALERDLSAVVTAVITNAGSRQWVIYAKSAGVCANRIKAIPRKSDASPIALDSDDDANWSFFYVAILDGIRK